MVPTVCSTVGHPSTQAGRGAIAQVGPSGEDGAVSVSGSPIATFDHREFPVARAVELKGSATVSVCIPARDEQATVGRVVATVRDALMGRTGLVDELVVVDDGSLDATAGLAARAGARVVASGPVGSRGEPVGTGKGGAMAAGLAATSGDLVVFLDADVTNMRPHFVSGLLGPLLARPGTVLVKGSYTRSLHGSPTGGGRVTELVARPLLALLFPELAGVSQPLAGETALRRSALAEIELAAGYGVEMALLLDVAARFGVGSVAQVDLGTRAHRNRPLAELAPQAREVMAAALARAGVAVA
jgi:glucosyl-3-phosphoglycerate synthase